MSGHHQQTVREVQQKLNEKGYQAGAVDGIMGQQTQQALQEFQRSQNISGAGQLNQQTLSALGVQAQAGMGGSMRQGASGSGSSSMGSGSSSMGSQSSTVPGGTPGGTTGQTSGSMSGNTTSGSTSGGMSSGSMGSGSTSGSTASKTDPDRRSSAGSATTTR